MVFAIAELWTELRWCVILVALARRGVRIKLHGGKVVVRQWWLPAL